MVFLLQTVAAHKTTGSAPRPGLQGPQTRLGRRLEEVAKAVGRGYCRLKMPLSLALAVRGTVAGQSLGALEGAGRATPPPLFNASLAPPPGHKHTLRGATSCETRGIRTSPPSGLLQCTYTVTARRCGPTPPAPCCRPPPGDFEGGGGVAQTATSLARLGVPSPGPSMRDEGGNGRGRRRCGPMCCGAHPLGRPLPMTDWRARARGGEGCLRRCGAHMYIYVRRLHSGLPRAPARAPSNNSAPLPPPPPPQTKNKIGPNFLPGFRPIKLFGVVEDVCYASATHSILVCL